MPIQNAYNPRMYFRFRKLMDTLYRNKWFDRVVLAFILFNCVVMALESPDLDDQSTVSPNNNLY